MNERYVKWYTPWRSREFEMLVFGEERGLPLVLFPTSGARYYENKDFVHPADECVPTTPSKT